MAVARLAHIATAIFSLLTIWTQAAELLKGHYRYHFVNELSEERRQRWLVGKVDIARGSGARVLFCLML